ncbi:MAG: hypothetical protein ABS85_11865 [Sphingobacteriales bacterium SCN 48-20]|nr:MAG: hypothetical protein ABS85_11865 [Sphingobacteriales bacterium SCN 48-20]
MKEDLPPQCLIVDDNRVARLMLRQFLDPFHILEDGLAHGETPNRDQEGTARHPVTQFGFMNGSMRDFRGDDHSFLQHD